MKNMNQLSEIIPSSDDIKQKTKDAIELARLQDAANVERLLFLEIHLKQIKEFIDIKSDNGDTSLDYQVTGFPHSSSSVDLFLELKSFIDKAGYDVDYSLVQKRLIIEWPLT